MQQNVTPRGGTRSSAIDKATKDADWSKILTPVPEEMFHPTKVTEVPE
jgi:hypothetical protein